MITPIEIYNGGRIKVALEAISLMKATHRCIRGSRLLAHRIIVQRSLWEDGARINLFR